MKSPFLTPRLVGKEYRLVRRGKLPKELIASHVLARINFDWKSRSRVIGESVGRLYTAI